MRSRLVCALFLAAVVLPARAGLFDDEEARRRIEQLRTELAQRLDRLESLSGSSIQLANQIEQLRGEIAQLRGQIEVLTYESEAAQKRQKDFYVDLDNRLRRLEARAPAADAQAAPPAADPAAETRDYEAALNLFKGGKYKEALAAFQAFIKTYPNSAFTPSAHYWSGSAHYQLGEFKKAGEMFGKVAANWPNDPKAPDAMLGMANSMQESGDARGARNVLENLAEKYPKSSAAQVAKQRLAPKKRK
jgi:tol-pal system protein YbgF